MTTRDPAISCLRLRRSGLLSTYVSRRSSSSRRRDGVRAHLRKCSRCRELAIVLRELQLSSTRRREQ